MTDSTTHSANFYRGSSLLTFYNANALPVSYIHTELFHYLLPVF